TDPRLLDVRGALDVLPPLPLGGEGAESNAARATGTEGAAGKFAPKFAPTRYKPGQTETTADRATGELDNVGRADPLAVSGMPDKRKEHLATAVSGSLRVGATGLDPVTPSVSRCAGVFHRRLPVSVSTCFLGSFRGSDV